MGIVISESTVRELYKGKAKKIREQHCLSCNRVLAFEITDKFGSDGEYWIVSGAIKSKGTIEHSFKRSGRWFGNYLKCPSCGRSGKLPMDKPLNYEAMQKSKEERDAVSGN